MSRTCPNCGTSYPDDVYFCGEDGAIVIQEQSPEDFDPRLGQQVGEYILAARVADGAMGRVFEAHHPESKQRVAIKILHEPVVADRVAVERFRREYESAAEMDHPFIVTVFEHGTTGDGSHYMTMEFLEGQELSRALHGKVPMLLARVIRIAAQVALALDYAHSFGFIHRDLKPDNIFLCDDPDGPLVRILDFGSVKLQMETGPKLTALGTTVGSPCYMSPEQAAGAGDVDLRTDVFALGAIVYEMLTNQTAFDAPSVGAVLMKIMEEQPPAPSTVHPACPALLDGPVLRALAKDKSDRPGSAVGFANELLAALGLQGDAERWAYESELSITRAIAAAHAGRASAPSKSGRDSSSGALTPQRPSRWSSMPPVLTRTRANLPILVSLTIGLAVIGGVVLYLIT